MSATPVTHHKTRVGKVLLHWVRAGDGPETVVLLHGFPQHWLMWKRLLPLVGAEGLFVVATFCEQGPPRPASKVPNGTEVELVALVSIGTRGGAPTAPEDRG